MSDWVAVGATVDRREHAHSLSGVHERMASGSWDADAPVSPLLRPVIARSWQRSLAYGLTPAAGAPGTGAARPLSVDELARRRRGHPLAIAPDVVARAFAGVDDPHHLIFVADADGQLLWVEGRPPVVARANEAGVVVGRSFAEAHRGTTAIGTSLAEGRAVQIFAGEHFQVGFHPLGCSAAPVRDPLSGEIVGAVGVSGSFTATHPHSLSLVSLGARAIEHQLLADAHAFAARTFNMTEATFAVVGRDRGALRFGGRHLRLSRRHTEMLLLLWLVPEGLTAERMAAEIYGLGGRAGTVRTEMHRLRSILGELIGERPYRLLGRVACDVDGVGALIESGDLAQAMAHYPGATLTATTAPRLVELRDAIDDRIRSAVLASQDVDLIERWLRTPAGRDDAQASRALMARLERDDPRRAAERSRLRRLAAGERGASAP